MNQDQLSEILKALSDPMRLTILSYFQEGGLVSCSDILSHCPRSQPTVSHHLGKLAEAGILTEHKVGTQKSFSVNSVFLKEIGINFPLLIKHASLTESPHGTTDH